MALVVIKSGEGSGSRQGFRRRHAGQDHYLGTALVDARRRIVHTGAMETYRTPLVAALATVAVLCAGCGPKEKPITELQRKEAAHMVSEADFAMTLRDYPRAETSLAKAVELAPDMGSYWINLGIARKRQGNTSGAKDAYQRALRAYETQAKKNATDADPWFRQIYVLALLGRPDDARAMADKMAKTFPNNRNVRVFIEEKHLDQMLADPGTKSNAL
jgi:tetratricopeptide (TPR) repeat protein